MPLDPAPAESIASIATDPVRFGALREGLRRYCFSILRNEADAEDAVQLTLERALRYQPARSDSGRWLIAIARNVCRDTLAASRPDQVPLETAGAYEAMDRPGDPEHEVATRHALAGALDSLTPTERRAVGASWMLDQTSYDAARSVGLAHQTLRVHLARARKKLAVYLDDLERATAGFLPWLVTLHQRAGRRIVAALNRDAALSDRLVVLTAPPLALAMTIASVAVFEAHSAVSHGPAAAHVAAAPVFELPQTSTAFRAHSPGPTAGGSGHSSGVVGGLLPAISPGRPEDAYVSDVEPSPSYPQDHTLFASATDSACGGRAACGELFVSNDAGHSWTNLRPVGLQSFAQLLLPPGSFPDHTFYAFGSAGLQMTTDGGHTFMTLVSDLPGYAGLMPPGMSTFVSVANVDLWNFATKATPGLAGAYPPGILAVGSALPVPSAGGWSFLQPVQVPGSSEHVLVCGASPPCSMGASLPWVDQATKLVTTPDGRVVAALNASGLAISRDGGATFTSAGQGNASDVALTELPGGGVRVILVAAEAKPAVLVSDDYGQSWHEAGGLPRGAIPRLVRVTTGGAVVLELVQAGRPTVLYGYERSLDGGAIWTSA